MIFWIASYPKSGNTWLRALISAYYYSEKGDFNDELLKKIDQFPTRKYFKEFKYDKKTVGDTCKFWIKAQEKVNKTKEIKFFKTHNVFGKINNFDFTNNQNSIGGLYIVRDPRNVITSIKNHYELNDEKAIDWMINEKNFLYDVEKFEEVGFSDFQFISSWKTNYKSWKVQKKIPIKFIKYEDLINRKKTTLIKTFKFLKDIKIYNSELDMIKLNKIIKTTEFNEMQKLEKKETFTESMIDVKTGTRKPFFRLGPGNNWKNDLSIKNCNKIEKAFQEEMLELGYL